MLLVFSLFFAFASFSADYCTDIFNDRFTTPELEKAFSNKVKMVKKVKRLGLDAYISQWAVRQKKYQGPFAKTGETLIVGIRDRKELKKWREKIGKRSIGLIVDGLPEHNPATAWLRVGEKLFSFVDIMDGNSPRSLTRLMSGYTEATFMVTAAEMRAILNFFEQRANGIKAKSDIRNGPKKGERIDPIFDETKMTLVEESCAAACSSFINPKWLEHLDNPKVLLDLKERLGLIPSAVAKHFIWKHARNPKLASLTLFGTDVSLEGLNLNLLENMQWGRLRGIPAYGIVPDLKDSSRSKTLWTKRITLKNWLKTIEN